MADCEDHLSCLLPQVSDGGVHSHISHLEALLEAAKMAAVPQAFVHFFSDGRDTSPTSGSEFLPAFRKVCVCVWNVTLIVIVDTFVKFSVSLK